ncbi:MAG: hypothetical protein ACX98W_10670 [bacterium]
MKNPIAAVEEPAGRVQEALTDRSFSAREVFGGEIGDLELKRIVLAEEEDSRK